MIIYYNINFNILNVNIITISFITKFFEIKLRKVKQVSFFKKFNVLLNIIYITIKYLC